MVKLLGQYLSAKGSVAQQPGDIKRYAPYPGMGDAERYALSSTILKSNEKVILSKR